MRISQIGYGMRKGGLEPPRSCERQPLKLVRLPIPPLPLGWVARQYRAAELRSIAGTRRASNQTTSSRRRRTVPLRPALADKLSFVLRLLVAALLVCLPGALFAQ